MGGEGARIADMYVAQNGGATLERVLVQKGIVLPVYDSANPVSVQAWKDASKALADGASGNVKVILGDSVSPSGIWNTIELPALKANTKVSKVIAVDIKTGRETILFKR